MLSDSWHAVHCNIMMGNRCTISSSPADSAAYIHSTHKPDKVKTSMSKEGSVHEDHSSACRSTASQPQRRVAIERQATAPSVPARHQVHGYEEDGRGALIMQSPPEDGHAGTSNDRPGPHDYSPDKLHLMRAGPAAGWGSSKSQRCADAYLKRSHVRQFCPLCNSAAHHNWCEQFEKIAWYIFILVYES
jgi:hypothetical protein